MVHNKMLEQVAQEKADALKTKISQVIFRYQTGANKEKLVSETKKNDCSGKSGL